jgi:SAM-dependent methyltransferase
MGEHPTTESLDEWFRRLPGTLVQQREREILSAYAERLFGYQLVQVGSVGDDHEHLLRCPIQHKQIVYPHWRESGDQHVIVAEPERLPIASDSVDAVVLPHTLDLARDPHQVVREAERLLIPEGRLILTCFNPLSLWGLWRLVLRRTGRLPWSGHFVSYPRLQDWLRLMGFAIERSEVMMFRPPIRSEPVLRRLTLLETYGERYWPMLAGVYVVQAIKRVSTLTPVGPRWRRLRPLGQGVIEPTTRGWNRV